MFVPDIECRHSVQWFFAILAYAMSDIPKTLCYIGIYRALAPRDKVYIEELKRRGAVIFECVSSAAGLEKYREIWRSVRRAARESDFVWVGYLSVFAVPVAYLATRKKIVYNALGSAYEGYILDRQIASKYSLKALFFWVADFIAFHLADTVLVESESQKRYLGKQFLVPRSKLQVIFTGVDEDIFHPDPSIKKQDTFTVAFRGMFLPATGVEIVLEAAKLLKNEPVRFWISGWGQLRDKVHHYIDTHKLTNVELNTMFLQPDELRRRMLSAHVMLGQFSKNFRLDRTIQHKTSEALALGMPYITRDSASNRELLQDGENCLFVAPADARALADKILWAKKNPDVLQKIGMNARATYEKKLAPTVLGEEVWKVLESLKV